MMIQQKTIASLAIERALEIHLEGASVWVTSLDVAGRRLSRELQSASVLVEFVAEPSEGSSLTLGGLANTVDNLGSSGVLLAEVQNELAKDGVQVTLQGLTVAESEQVSSSGGGLTGGIITLIVILVVVVAIAIPFGVWQKKQKDKYYDLAKSSKADLEKGPSGSAAASTPAGVQDIQLEEVKQEVQV